MVLDTVEPCAGKQHRGQTTHSLTDRTRPTPERPDRRTRHWLALRCRSASLLAGLALGYALGWHESLSLAGSATAEGSAEAACRRQSLPGARRLHLFYVVAVAFSFPAVTVLKVIGGFLFGWLAGGSLYSRRRHGRRGGAVPCRPHGLRRFSERPGGHTRSAGLQAGSREDAFSYLLAMRLAPFIPFFVVSIAPALFNVRLKTFLAATAARRTAGSFLLCLARTRAPRRARGRRRRPGGTSPFPTSLPPRLRIALLALTLVAVLATIVRKVRGPQVS